jgi:hypothetical protein
VAFIWLRKFSASGLTGAATRWVLRQYLINVTGSHRTHWMVPLLPIEQLQDFLFRGNVHVNV